MPWSDPEKNAEAVRRWRNAHPGYWRQYPRTRSTVSRYTALEEDLRQQAVLYRLSRRKVDHPALYRQRERRWIQATDFWTSDGSGQAQRRTGQLDEE